MLCIGSLFLNQASLFRDAGDFNVQIPEGVISQLSPVVDAAFTRIGGASDGKVEGGGGDRDETAISVLRPPENLVDSSVSEDHFERICEKNDGKQTDFCVNVVTPAEVYANRIWLNSLCPIDKTINDVQQTRNQEILVGQFLEWKSVLQIPIAQEQANPRKPRQTSIVSEHEMNPTKPIGSFSETAALMLTKIRCGDHFSLVRFGDGELFILSNKKISRVG